VTGLPAALLIQMNAAGRPVVSVDLPSGVDADSGAVRGACAYASLTVSFGFPKLGLALQPAKSFSGKLVAADIGIPLSLASRLEGPFADLSEPDAMRALLPSRGVQAHKHNSGTLLVVAGSEQYLGAALLTAQAALSSGAGFVHLLVPQAQVQAAQAAVPEAVVSPQSLAKALELSKKAHAVVVGPGLGRSKESLELARALFERLDKPALFDGDALYALSEGGELKPGGPRLLTPHDGEFARLSGGPEGLEKDRPAAARALAKASGCVVLLKGPSTLVAAPEGGMGVNSSGNPALASAGSGDVLSGLCGALLSQGLSPFEAGRLGAYLHGAAADARVEVRGSVGLTAQELAARLPEAFFQLRGKA
jgi:NAD(P)H-hydrate epimerase